MSLVSREVLSGDDSPYLLHYFSICIVYFSICIVLVTVR